MENIRYNEDFIKILGELYSILSRQGEPFRAKAYQKAQETIMWYIYDCFNPDGSIVPLEDESGKIFTLKDANDLWSYIKYKVK